MLIHGRDADRGAAVAAELSAKSPGSVAFHRDDIADPSAPARMISAAIAAFGKLDALVNNAALVTRSNLSNTDAAFFDRMMAVNVRAPMLLIQAAFPHLKAAGGAVLNIGSVNGYCGEANLLAYSISKGGLMTLSRNLSDALGRDGVRVNHFNVGWVLTPNEYQVKIADGLPPDWPERVGRPKCPSGRLLKPEEIAAAAVYWISDESRPISGSVLEIEQHPVIGRNPPKEVEPN